MKRKKRSENYDKNDAQSTSLIQLKQFLISLKDARYAARWYFKSLNENENTDLLKAMKFGKNWINRTYHDESLHFHRCNFISSYRPKRTPETQAFFVDANFMFFHVVAIIAKD